METRKTTLDERVEIVKDCIEHDFNYNLIAKKYFVSYSQVRRWTLKYKENGIVGLEDRRGKAKKKMS
ncbi:helix-turn-helix domain-containing protein [Clostridioides difficile]